MVRQCSFCKTGVLEKGDCHEVCTSCGVMTDVPQFADASTAEGTSFLSGGSSVQHFYASGVLNKQLIDSNSGAKYPAYMKVGKKKIASLCTALSLGTDVYNYAFSLYKMLGDKELKHKPTERREVFCCACVFIACREFTLPVTMAYIAAIDTCSADVYFAAVKVIERSLNIKTKPQNIDDLVESVVMNSLQPGIVATNNVLILTKHVLQLVADLFLSQGRKPQALIGAAFYLAYQSEDFVARRKLKSTQVLNKRLSIAPSVKLMRPALLELLKSIPWIGAHQHTAEFIPYHLNDILRHRKTLIRTALRRTEQDNVVYPDDSETSVENNVPSATATALSSSRDSSKKDLVDCNVRLPISDDTTSKRELHTCTSPTREARVRTYTDNVYDHVTQSTVFHPPAFKRARERSREREEIGRYVTNGLEMFQRLSEKLNATE